MSKKVKPKSPSEGRLLAQLERLNNKEQKQSAENHMQRQKILRQLAKCLRSQGR